MSSLVTRPWRPVPGTWCTSTLCSAAILRTSGVDFVRSRSSSVCGPSPGGAPADGAGAAAAPLPPPVDPDAVAPVLRFTPATIADRPVKT
jgi:hypothetical protein